MELHLPGSKAKNKTTGPEFSFADSSPCLSIYLFYWYLSAFWLIIQLRDLLCIKIVLNAYWTLTTMRSSFLFYFCYRSLILLLTITRSKVISPFISIFTKDVFFQALLSTTVFLQSSYFEVLTASISQCDYIGDKAFK